MRLYQPMVIPLGMSLLMMLFANIAVTLKTPPMPRPWRNWRRGYPAVNPAPALSANQKLSQEVSGGYPDNRSIPPPSRPAGAIIELRPDGSRRFVLDDDAIEWAEGRR